METVQIGYQNVTGMLRPNELYVRITALVYEHGFFFPNDNCVAKNRTKNQTYWGSPICPGGFPRANVHPSFDEEE